jgi:hypothetical protein
MNEFQLGDLITFAMRGGKYGLAQFIHIENLSQYDHYHLAIRDAVLEAGEGGLDAFGDPYERSHDLSRTEDAPVVVDHVALTYDALIASEPVVVGHEEVDESMLDGYQIFLTFMRADLIKRGLMKYYEESDEEVEDEFSDEELEEGEVDEESEYEVVDAEEKEAEAAEEQTEEAPAESIAIKGHTWHMRVFDRPLGDVLFELHEIFEGEEFRSTELGQFINSFFDGSRSEEIEELVNRFVDGDYGAGHELLAYGPAAADILSRHLTDSTTPELAEDILRILCDTGSSRAYEIVAEFFAVHYDQLDDSLRLPAIRGFCYAVMLTGGTPEPLHTHLPKLDDLDDPELADDLQMAIDGMRNASQHGQAAG